MKILVTGATGFVGNTLIPELRRSFPDSPVSAFVLPGDRMKEFLPKNPGLRIIEGDVVNRVDVMNAVAGHTHVVHLAGLISYWKKDYPKLMQVNRDGVEYIVKACLFHRVRRMVHVSSAGAVGFYPHGRLATEETPFNWPPHFHYMRSKFEGQQKVERAVVEKGLDAVILLPAAIMGPGDRNRESPLNRMLSMVYRGRLFGCFSGGLAVVDVRDLVSIIVKSLKVGKKGEKYLVVGANVEYREVMKRIGSYAGKKVYPFRFPAFILTLLGFLSEAVSDVTQRKPLLTASYGKLSGWKPYYANEKSRRDFSHEYISFEKMIKDTCQYFEENLKINPEGSEKDVVVRSEL
ncbi:MAG: NAD-dependent epimerase/dehydratase family protein [Candidatus Aminicenantales bacterium]